MTRYPRVALLLAMVASIGAFGQRSDTIFQSLFSNSTATGNSGLIRNIGQSQHRAIVILTNAPAKSCPAQNVDMTFQGSFDAATWFEIGTPLTSIPHDNANNLIATVEADGGYPYLRFAINSFDTVNCLATVNYSGTLYPNPAASAVAPNYNARGMRALAFHVSAAGDNTIFNDSSSNRFISVYGLFLSADGATTISICHATGIPLAAGEKIILPNSGVVQCVLNRGENLVVNSSMPVTISGSVVLRQEDNP